jgi:hypothetical protein
LSLEIRNGSVRILQPDEKTTSGTGFLLSDSGLIATCSHVIQDEKLQVRGYPRPEKVAVVFHATGEHRFARVLPEGWRSADMEDVAILQLEGSLPPGVMHLSLGSSEGSGGHPFKTFGFPDFNPDEGIFGDGHIMDPTSMQGMKVLQVSSPQITPGFSGAPVLDTTSRRVVGMITSIAAPDKFGRLAETAFITPTEVLIAIYPQLMPSDVRPYLGLAAFTEKDAEFFFGRRKVVDSLVEALRSKPRFLLVMGPSGSGKSSVVQAGLIPKLRKGTLPGSDRWSILVVRPANLPFEQLEKAGLKGASQSLEESAKRYLRMQTGQERLLLVLDQFEEFLVTCPVPLRQKLWSELSTLLESDIEITIVAVMRDDFYSRFAQDAPRRVMEWTQRGYSQVTSNLDAEDLREIIQEPAKRIGLSLEEGLTDIIISDVVASGQSDGSRSGRSTILPLLEFALTQLWERREHGILTHQAYNSIGKVTGSLTTWADQVCRSLEKDGLGQLTRRIFTDLVNLGDEAQRLPDSRRRRSLDDLCNQEEEREPVHRIVQRLADARLVTTSTDKNQVTVEIIHDSLIREWSRLRQWLKEDRSFLAWDRKIEREAKEWKETSPEDASNRDEGRLLRGLRLLEAESWCKDRLIDIGELEGEFISASLDLRDREKAEKEKEQLEKERTKWHIIQILVAFSLVSLILACFAWYQWDQAGKQKEETIARYLTLQSESAISNPSNFIDSAKYAIESLKHSRTFEGDLALRRAIRLFPYQSALINNSSKEGIEIINPDWGKTVRVLSTSSGKELISLKHNESVSKIKFSPDGKSLATVAAWPDFAARVWDLSTGKKLMEFPNDGPVSYIAFSPDGLKLATTSLDDTTRLWDIKSGNELIKFIENVPANILAFSPDGARLAIASEDYTLRVWDARSGKELNVFLLNDLATSIAFSPDGDRLATACFNNTTSVVWDVLTGQELTTMPHDAPVSLIAFSPDGNELFTLSDDNTAWTWDSHTGKYLASVNRDFLRDSVEFSPDHSRIAVTINQSDDIICESCSHLGSNLTTKEWRMRYCEGCSAS